MAINCDEFGDVNDERELMEQYELRSESVTEVVKAGNVMALFSPSNALELFYLCKVINSGTATEDMYDKFEHYIPKGFSYLSVHYYEKKANSEFSKNGHVIYKLSKNKDPAYVLPAQVM